MNYLQFDPPTDVTLKKYGLTADEWLDILEKQGNVCPICKKVPNPNKTTGKIRWVTDHDHVKGWKAMSPEKRKLYVRGITCWFCNHSYLGRGITVDKARNAADYLEEYDQRKP